MSSYEPRRALVEEPGRTAAPASGDGPSSARRTEESLETTAAQAGGVPGVSTEPLSDPGAPAGGYLSHRQILVVIGGLMAGMFLAALGARSPTCAGGGRSSRPRSWSSSSAR